MVDPNDRKGAGGGGFRIRDCALIGQATGRRAQNLRELREGLTYVHSASIYHHIWGRLLRPTFDEPEYNNDFAAWCSHALHDRALAERLSAINSAEYGRLEDLRQELLDIIETRLDEEEVIPWAQADQQFYFLRSTTIVFDTDHVVKRPEDFPEALSHMSVGSVFYHFIDARRRTPDSVDDFSAWLADFAGAYAPLMERINAIDPWFSSLAQLRRRLGRIFTEYFHTGTKG